MNWNMLLAVVISLFVAACFEPEDSDKAPGVSRDPLDSLLGYYDGTIVRTTCKQPNLPAPGSCGLMETDTLSAASSSISLRFDTLTLFLPGFGALDILPGDTVYADSTDTIGTVSCFRIPAQALSPEGPVYIADVPVSSVGEANEIAPSVCPESSGGLNPFTLMIRNDSNFVQAPRRTFRLHRVSPPSPD